MKSKNWKLEKEWKDSYYKTKNSLYKHKNGLRLIYSNKPDSSELNITYTILGGSYFEDELNVPYGTAHFLEHMICKPNNLLKSDAAIRKYKYGNRQEPSLKFNANCNYNTINLTADIHKDGWEKSIKFLYHTVDYPTVKFRKYIESEKKVVIAESMRYKRDDRNPVLVQNKFLLGEKYKRYQKLSLGYPESISKITSKDLEKYWESIHNPQNIIISIQNRGEITKNMLADISSIAQLSSKNQKEEALKIKLLKINNDKFKYKCFRNKDAQDIRLDFSFWIPTAKGEAYTDEQYIENLLKNLARSAMKLVLHKRLREDKKLIYMCDNYINGFFPHKNIAGIIIDVELVNLKLVLDEVYSMFYGPEVYSPFYRFLRSREFKIWLEDRISQDLFMGNIDYDRNYAYRLGLLALTDYTPYIFDYDKSKKLIRDIKSKKVYNYSKELFYNNKPRLFIDSPYKSKEIEEVIESSNFGKKMLK